MDSNFVHLHLHTEYSLLDGAAKIKEVVKIARGFGMPALAITDHGAMYGVVEFYKACRKEGLKPILGCEVYMAPRTMADRTPRVDDKLYHLVLLAENDTGYRNLLNLVSLSYTNGFYYKPRLDKDTLAAYSQGLVALSGCIAGEVAVHTLSGLLDKARQAAGEYQEIFGKGNFFLELQNNGFPEQRMVNKELVNLHKKLGIPLVATNDVHYLKREDAEIQDVLMCIQTGKSVDDPDRLKFQTKELYFKSGQEMASLFNELPSALQNTLEIANRCNVEIDFGASHLPDYQVPTGYTLDSYLRKLCYEGAEQIYGQGWKPYKTLTMSLQLSGGDDFLISGTEDGLNCQVKERLELELQVISKMNFSAYFLIVWDFIHFAKQRGIAVGPGRGSAAGSLVAYTLGITNIDPLKYGLLFERFLNPERLSMPDIDIDFCFERRGEVIEHVVKKYGADRVAQIITFGTMAARAAIRDVGRALNMPYGEVDRVAKLVPAEMHMTIEKALAVTPEFKELYEERPQVRKLIDTASALEGMPRHASTHAAGVVITKEPLTHYLPLYRTFDGVITTQFTKETVEEMGLLKMDLLGLRTLTVVGDTVRLINEKGKALLDINRIPLDDKRTYEMLVRGESAGVFQLESSGMRAILRDLKPQTFEDIIALVALYRPGPLGSGMVEDFIKRKAGKIKIDYFHPDLEPVLKETYGVILYQEQVMKIAQNMAGYTLGQADSLRKAMGKKIPEIMRLHRDWFIYGTSTDEKGNPLSHPIPGAKSLGYDPNLTEKIFDLIEYFAGYGFNKSHSAAYAMISYQTAYLKANYPHAYMSALLTSVRDNPDKVAVYIEECRRLGIEVLPPDVNESRQKFTIVDNKIRFGLAAIKNVGLAAVEEIIKVREKEGYFRDFFDFCQRLEPRVINKRVLESLIKGGSFDSQGYRRAQLMAAVDLGVAFAQQAQKERLSGQLSLLEMWGEEAGQSIGTTLPEINEYPEEELLAMEKDILGVYISGHPLAGYREVIKKQATAMASEVKELEPDTRIAIGGLVTGIKRINTRRGEIMAFVTLEDLTGTVEVILFPRLYQQHHQIFQDKLVVLIRGRISGSGEEAKIIAEEVSSLDSFVNRELDLQPIDEELYLQLANCSLDLLAQVQFILRKYHGSSPVYLYFPDEKKLAKVKEELWVNLTMPIENELEKLLGTGNVKVKRANCS